MKSLPESGVKTKKEGNLLRLLFDFEKVEAPANQDDDQRPVADDLYYCESIDVHGSGYGDIISAIVRDRYSEDEKDAIMANYQLAIDDECSEIKAEEYRQEYTALQNWRSRAKEIARIVTAQA